MTLRGEDSFCCWLDHLGHLSVSGADATSFLHRQMTCDMEGIGVDRARIGGYLSAKGRMLASMIVWRVDTGWVLHLSGDLVDLVAQRMRTHVLRSKVDISDLGSTPAMLGFAGQASEAVLHRWFPTVPSEVLGKAESEFGSLVRLASVGENTRWQWFGRKAVLMEVASVVHHSMGLADASAWLLMEIDSGEPRISLPTSGTLVPDD